MAYISWIITLPLTVIAVLFVVSNTEKVDFYLYPGAVAWSLPVYAVGLALLLGGFLAGALFVSLHAQKTMFRYWQEKNKSARLGKELDDMHRKSEAAETAAVAGTLPALPKTSV